MINNKYLVGNGFIGKNLKKIKRDIINSKYIVYAAGISHSKTKSKNELNREFNSIYKFAKKNYLKKIIYISTADVSHNLFYKIIVSLNCHTKLFYP